MRKLLLGFLVLSIAGGAAYLRWHRPKPPLEAAYAGNRQVIVWSTMAQVRETMATIGYGERVDVLDRLDDYVKVRTATGVTGWTAKGDLLTEDFWKKAQDLEVETNRLPVEARGHTKVLSNMRMEPGRASPRIRQIGAKVPVDLYERQVAEVAPIPDASPDNDATAGPSTATSAVPAPSSVKKEDWWLVRAHLPDRTTPSGWILGRFMDLDLPAPLPDYASAAGLRVVAWFELNQVEDENGGKKPQYLVVGIRGGEGQACDFTLMRAYTWGKQRERYETAFVQSDVCGKLPLKLTQPAQPGGDVTFEFEDLEKGSDGKRVYYMHQTIVREARTASAPRATRVPGAPKRKHG